MSKEYRQTITLSTGEKREVERWQTMSGEVEYIRDIETGFTWSAYAFRDCVRKLEEFLSKPFEKEDMKQFKTLKDINRTTPEGELAYRLLIELCKTEEHKNTKINDMLRLTADKTYVVYHPVKVNC